MGSADATVRYDVQNFADWDGDMFRGDEAVPHSFCNFWAPCPSHQTPPQMLFPSKDRGGIVITEGITERTHVD